MDPSIPPALHPPPTTVSPTPYDFIVNPNQQAKKRGLFGGGGSTYKRLIIAAGVGVGLIVIAIIIGSILGSSSKSSNQQLVNLAEQQQEIIRVASLGLAQAQSSTPDTQNLAITTQLSIQTNQQATLALLKSRGQKVDPKLLGLKKDSSTDAQIANSTQNGTFDATFIQIIDSQLTAYQMSLQTIYKGSSSTAEKQLMQSSYSNAALLLSDPAVKNQ